MVALLDLESRANLQELVLTQSEARALVKVAQELQGQDHADVAARLLSGTLVRFKKQGKYRLAPIASLRLPPDAPAPTLVVLGYAELTLEKLSSTNPFTSDAAYEASGRQEAARLAAAAAAAGGLDLWQAAAAVWRKKVAQGWAPQLQQLMAMHGIGRLLHDLDDAAMIEAVAENLDPLPPTAPAAPPPARQQPHAEQPVGQPEPQPAADHPLAPVPAAEPELPPHVLPPQPPPAQQAAVAHDPDDLPPHLRPQPLRAAQQPMQQPALPPQQQAVLQQVEQQWPHQLWPVVQRQPLPPLAQQREQQAAEAEAPTPVLSSLSGAAPAAWDAAMAAEAQPSSAQHPGAAQPAELHAAGRAQQAEVQLVAPEQQPPTDQLEEAQSLLLDLLEQQQQQQHEVPPPPPPPQQQPTVPLQEAEGQLPLLPPPPPPEPPVKEEPQQQPEPLIEPLVGQRAVQQEPANGQLTMAAVQHEQGHPAEPQERALPRSVSEPLQRLPPGGVGAPPVLPRSISERPRAQQLPPGLQQGPPHAQQLPPGLQPQGQGPPASSDAQKPQLQPQVQQPPQQQEWSVLVANLGDAFTVEQLETYFRQRYPSVTSAAIPRIERTGEPKGFGFVRFARREEQLRAAREMDGHVLPGGRKIGTGLAGTAGGPVQPAPTPAAAAAPALGSAGTGTIKQQAAQPPPAAVLPAAAAAAAAAVQQEKAYSPERQPQCQQQALQQPQKPQQQGQREQLRRSVSRETSPPVRNGVPTAGTAAAAAAVGRASNMAGAAAAAGPAARPPAPLGRQQSFPAAVPGAWQPSFPAAGVEGPLEQQTSLPAAGLGGPLGRQPSFPAAAAGAALGRQPSIPPAVAGPAFERQLSFPPALAAAGAAQAMVPMMWPAGAFGAAGFVPIMLPGNRLGYTALRPGMPGMPAVLGQSMHPGMTAMPAGGLAMPAGGGRALGGMAARPPPPPPAPAQKLQHFGSGHSSGDLVNLEAAGRQSNGLEAAQHSGSGRSGSRGRSRNRSRSRSRSPRSDNDKRRRGSPRRRSRSRSRSPRRDSGRRSGPAAESPGRNGPVLPLWLPPLLKAACKSVAFDSGIPFPAIRLLPVLDDLRGERDCLYRAGSNLRHVCDFLQFTRTADVELRPDGPLIVRLR